MIGTSYGIYNKNSGTIKFIEGMIKSSCDIFNNSYGIYNVSNGDVIVEGGTINSTGKNPFGIYNDIGNMKMTKGTINCTRNKWGLYLWYL